ncbi:MAG: shikimate kinase [Pirellulales bacterium]
MTQAPIFLVGYRGTGKTTVARLVAQRLARESLDADYEIERRAGKSIAAMFADEGEGPFRELEAAVIADLARTRLVVSTGGGAVLREANRAAMLAAGPIVWLTASVDTIAKRIASDVATARLRPNLTAAGGRAEIEAVLAARTPIYEACATFVVDTEGKTPAAVADEIVARLSPAAP